MTDRVIGSTAANLAAFATPAIPTLGERADGLAEISLPDATTRKLRAGLEPLGFNIRQDQIIDPLGGEFHYTLVHKNDRARRLIRLPDRILTNPNQKNRRLVNEVRDGFTNKFFREGTEIKLYIFHGENPHGTYKLLMEQRWPEQHGMRSKFVPLSEVDDLDTMSEDLRTHSVRLMFDLEGQEKPTPTTRPWSKIDFSEHLDLINLVADVPAFRDSAAAGRRSLVESAGTVNMFADFDFHGSPIETARRLLFELIENERLGPFLTVILSMPDLKPEYQKFIESLFQRYDL